VQSSKVRPRVIGAIVAATVIFGGTYAFAAGTVQNLLTLGSATTSTSSCQSQTIDLSFDPSASVANPALAVTLNNLDTASDACGGKTVRVELITGAKREENVETATLPTTGSTLTLHFLGANAEDVNGVKVTISGSPS